MSRNRTCFALIALVLLATVLFVGGATPVTLAANSDNQSVYNTSSLSALSSNATVFATGLSNPRGLVFGPDGNLYVAEGGTGGTQTTTLTQCIQVPFVGPYSGGFTSRISKINRGGIRSTVADNLPSSQTTPQTGSFVSGVADVAFIAGQLYGIEAGAGCSHGLAGTNNTVFRVNKNGTATNIADLSAFIKAHPVANPNPGDFEPDGTWYSMIALRGALYAIEPNHGELDKITPDGKISRVIDISATQGHIVPTAMVYHGGNFYVGNLAEFPATLGASKVWKITLDGHISVFAQGFTTVLGLAFDDEDHLYVLETSAPVTSPGPPVIPGTGRVVRVTRSGGLQVIATGLTFPTAMTFGPDGKLYVSNFGFTLGPAVGAGQIVRIKVDD